MASGALPLGTYHRAQALGSGSYGSVIAVYNDDGEQFALKLFDEDEDEDEIGLSLGAMREVSILRLLRHENSHTNIIAINDVQTGSSDDADEAGAGTDGCLSMAMPLFPDGSIMDALESNKIHTKAQKVHIAHGFLSAVAHLHENSIIHRDIKNDNVLLRQDAEGMFEPVLIDFSLAKIVDPSVVIPGGEHMMPRSIKETELTHTPSIGTPTYRAPEVIEEKEYSFPSDMWSVGVCLLELLLGKGLEANKDKGAISMIVDCLEGIPKDQPFPDLVRGLLEIDPSKRLTGRQALDSEVFRKHGLKVDQRTYCRINLRVALPFEGEEGGGEDSAQQKENATPCKGNNGRANKGGKNRRVNPVLSKRFQRIQKICRAMEWDNPQTAQAALTYTTQMSELCDMDDVDDPQAFLDCIILAHKFFERHLTDLSELDSLHSVFGNWDREEYVDNEGTIFMMMDFCLYPRQFLET